MIGLAGRWARIRSGAGIALSMAMTIGALVPMKAAAQDVPEYVVTLGGGMTVYAISTRVNTGSIVRGSVGYSPVSYLLLEAGARRHGCPDCHSFSILEGAVQVRRPGERVSPFASLGGGRSSDSEFMGSEWGLLAAVGSWFWVSGDWGLQLEARGRQVGSGDSMGEFSLGLARRFGSSGR